jgi:hypothetical protein
MQKCLSLAASVVSGATLAGKNLSRMTLARRGYQAESPAQPEFNARGCER